MVRLINDGNVDFIANCAYSILRIQEKFTSIVEYNNPHLFPCIYAMWHRNQFLVHGIEDKAHLSIQISNSIDGEIIARTVEKWGFKVVRGSAGKKGAVESTMQMISRLKNGECVGIMVDGPRGPLYNVKNGIMKLAQKSGAPIVPVNWYSPQKTFINLPSWDKMKTPLGKCNILNIYGEPVFVNSEATDEELLNIKENIRQQLLKLDAEAPNFYQDAVSKKMWDKKYECR